jgi:hypothetical protein
MAVSYAVSLGSKVDLKDYKIKQSKTFSSYIVLKGRLQTALFWSGQKQKLRLSAFTILTYKKTCQVSPSSGPL